MLKLLQQTIQSYRLAFLFLTACFPLFCLPVFFEGLQHIVEVKLGMFAAKDGPKLSAEDNNIRLIFGGFKALSLLFLTILIPRYFIHGQSKERVLKFSKSARLAAIVGFVVILAHVLWVFGIGPVVVEAIKVDATAAQKIILPLVAIMLLGLPLQTRVNRWMARVFDDAPLSEGENKALMKAMMGWPTLILVLAIMPFMALHYYLNNAAMGAPEFGLYALLGLDSLLVGWLALVMGASYYVLYRNARASHIKV